MRISLHNPLLGAHMSIAGGLHKALEAGAKLGCTSVQFFTHSNRQWGMRPLTATDIETFIQAQKTTQIECIVHATYLINLGSADVTTRKRSISMLRTELERCEELRISTLVVHPGARLDSSLEDCLLRISESLDEALTSTKGSCVVALETMAGQGSIVGKSFEELATMRQHAHHKERIGYCLDTCHVFAAGYPLATHNDYVALWEKFDTTLGLKNLKAIHLNDSQKPLGSYADRHTHIGEGVIGLEVFRSIMNDARLVHIPKILETPKDESLDDDRKNLELLRSLIT